MSAARRSAPRLTLVERAVVVVIVLLLVTISVVMRGMLRNQAYVDEMKSELRNLAAQQESYLYDHAVYAGGLDLLAAFTPTPRLSVAVREATTSGWSAVASHQSTLIRCSMFVGNAAPVGGAGEEGVIACG